MPRIHCRSRDGSPARTDAQRALYSVDGSVHDKVAVLARGFEPAPCQARGLDVLDGKLAPVDAAGSGEPRDGREGRTALSSSGSESFCFPTISIYDNRHAVR